jgi:hypothetical protein
MSVEAAVTGAMRGPAVSTQAAQRNRTIQYSRPTLSRNELRSVLESLVLEEFHSVRVCLTLKKRSRALLTFSTQLLSTPIHPHFTWRCLRLR